MRQSEYSLTQKLETL